MKIIIEFLRVMRKKLLNFRVNFLKGFCMDLKMDLLVILNNFALINFNNFENWIFTWKFVKMLQIFSSFLRIV